VVRVQQVSRDEARDAPADDADSHV
jgi:hypothetical protein